MSDPKPKQGPSEGGEKPKRREPEMPPSPEVHEGITQFDQRAEGIDRALAEHPDARAMLELKRELPPEAQVAGLARLQFHLIELLARAKKEKGVDIKNLKPGEIMAMAQRVGIEIKPLEPLAWQKYMELTAGPGDTSIYLIRAWPDILNQAETASLGWSEKLKKAWQENPGRTALYAAAGAAGVYLGFQLIKTVAGWFKGEEKTEKPKEKKEGWLGWLWGNKKTMGPLAIMAAGLFLGKDELKKMLLGLTKAQAEELVKNGQALPAQVQAAIAEHRPDIKAELDKAKGTAAGAAGETKEVAGAALGAAKETAGRALETVREADLRSTAIDAVPAGLTRLYAFEKRDFPELQADAFLNEIIGSLKQLENVPLEKVLAIYRQNEKKKKINPAELGVNLKSDAALFHAARLLSKTAEQYQKLNMGVDLNHFTVGQFYEHLARDPAHAIHGRLSEQFANLNADTVRDPVALAGAAFDGKAMEEFLRDNRDHYVDELSARFHIEIPPHEKAAFIALIGYLYTMGHVNLSWTPEQVMEVLNKAPTRPSETVKKAALDLFAALQKEINPDYLKSLVDDYDIRRVDSKPFDQILSRYLTVENLTFSSALEFALFKQGLQPEAQKEDSGTMGQGKKLAMLFVILRALKKINERDAHDKFMVNLGNALLRSPSELNVNLRFLLPYKALILRGARGYAEDIYEKAKTWAYGIQLPSDTPDFPEKMAKSDFADFSFAGLQEGAVGAARIPMDLFITVVENAKEAGDPTTDGTTLLKIIQGLGGMIFYHETDKGEKTGLIYLFGKYYFWKPMGIAKDTLEGVFSGSALKTYMVGTAPFVVWGATWQLFTSHERGIRRGIAMLRGAGRGLAAPITMPAAGIRKALNPPATVYRAARGVYRWAERMENIVRFRQMGTMGMMGRSAGNFVDYAGKAPSEGVTTLQKLRAWRRKPGEQFKKWLDEDIYASYRDRWRKLFANDYNNFFGFNPELDGSEAMRLQEESIKATRQTAERMQNLVQRLQGLKDLDKMTPNQFIQELNRLGADGNLLIRKELEALTKQARDPRQFQKLKAMIGISQKESLAARAAAPLRALREKVGVRAKQWLESNEWYKNFEAWKGAKFHTGDIVELARMGDRAKIVEYLKQKKVPADQAEELAARLQNTRQADDIVKAIKEVMGLEHVRFSPKVAQILKLARGAGAALAVTGTVVSGWEAVSAFAAAASTDNAERRNLLLGKGGLWTANLIADATGTYVLGAGLLGKGVVAGGAASTVGAAALPLIPITYMGTAVFESKEEATKTKEEWAQMDHEQLVHEWISTHELGAGEAYRVFTGAEKMQKEKMETRKKIVAAILNREEGKPPNAPVNQDRLYYIETMVHFQPGADYGEALKLLRESKTYADLILTRRLQMEKKKEDPTAELVIGGIDILDPRFEKPDRGAILQAMNALQEEAVAHIEDDKRTTFDQLSDRSLIDLYCQSLSYIQTGAEEVSEEDQILTFQLRSYLTHVRHINPEKEYTDWMAKLQQEGKMTPDHLMAMQNEAGKNLKKLRERPAEIIKEEEQYKPESMAVAAVDKLAKEQFGLIGRPTEEDLKQRLPESRGGFLGMYWNGNSWYVNRAGLDRDVNVGPVLTEPAVRRIIEVWRQDPDNVIETRQDALVDVVSLHQFDNQVRRMVQILEDGLNPKAEKPPKPKKEALEGMPVAANDNAERMRKVG